MADNDQNDLWTDIEGNLQTDTTSNDPETQKHIRSAINAYETNLLGSDYNPELELQKLKQTLSKERLSQGTFNLEHVEHPETISSPVPPGRHQGSTRKISRIGDNLTNIKQRWAQSLTIFVTAFATGAFIMRFAAMPTAELYRSGTDIIEINGINAQRVELHASEPSSLLNKVIPALVDAEIQFALLSRDKGYALLIHDLVPLSPKQEHFKELLGMNNLTTGTVIISIHEPSN